MPSNRETLDLLYGPNAVMDPRGVNETVQHFFGAGHYMRISTLKANEVVRMHVHSYDHLSILAVGRGRLMTDEETRDMAAGDHLVVHAGARHAFLALEPSVWLCIHREALAQVEGKAPEGVASSGHASLP